MPATASPAISNSLPLRRTRHGMDQVRAPAVAPFVEQLKKRRGGDQPGLPS
jgi:hypothetical protein